MSLMSNGLRLLFGSEPEAETAEAGAAGATAGGNETVVATSTNASDSTAASTNATGDAGDPDLELFFCDWEDEEEDEGWEIVWEIKIFWVIKIVRGKNSNCHN